MDILLDEIINFTRNQTRTNVARWFTLEKDYDVLEIYCEYSPKKVEDGVFTKQALEAAIELYIPEHERATDLTWEKYAPLSNFISISLDYEDTYLGCAHRQDRIQKHMICKDNSSLSFENHAPIKGTYSAVMNLHAVSSEVVTYHLKIIAK